MSKQQNKRKDIEALAADGWRFRKKKRKDAIYISARKGKEEKGLGRYSNEYWAMIEDVTRSLTKSPEFSNELTQARIGSDETKNPMINVFKEVSRNLGKYN